MKYSSVIIGTLNNINLHKLVEVEVKEKNVLFSKLDFSNLNEMQLLMLKNSCIEKEIILIPSFDNIKDLKKYKKIISLAFFVHWVLNLQYSISIEMNNNALLLLSDKSDDWHKNYDGNLGYAVSPSDDIDTLYYGFSAKIPNNPEKIISKEFDGFFLKEL